MKYFLFTVMVFNCGVGYSQSMKNPVPEDTMEEIYQQVKTPYKYGLIMVPEDDSKKIDCPTVFRIDGAWYMTYFIFDGRGYETWLAKSDNLLEWEELGRVMSFRDDSYWDWNEAAGYPSLQDTEWGGSYELEKFDGKYWMSYFGGNTAGYEAGLLSVGIAYTDRKPNKVYEWKRLDHPVLMATDKDARWWENKTIYKNSVIRDTGLNTGYPFVMYYNAKGDSINPNPTVERIGMAVSNDMVKWHRYMEDPVLNHHKGITGDAYIQKIGDVWVMFYFGAFWPNGRSDKAFNRFACSYDLINWTDWHGPNLIEPSENYDNLYAHKSFVVKWEGMVYHFYCAVNHKQQRGIALATSQDIGISNKKFK